MDFLVFKVEILIFFSNYIRRLLFSANVHDSKYRKWIFFNDLNYIYFTHHSRNSISRITAGTISISFTVVRKNSGKSPYIISILPQSNAYHSCRSNSSLLLSLNDKTASNGRAMKPTLLFLTRIERMTLTVQSEHLSE